MLLIDCEHRNKPKNCIVDLQDGDLESIKKYLNQMELLEEEVTSPWKHMC